MEICILHFMLRFFAVGGILLAQSYYIHVDRASRLYAQLSQNAANPFALARQGGIWRGLREIKPILFPASDSRLEGWFCLNFRGRDSLEGLESFSHMEGVLAVEGAVRRKLCASPLSLAGWHHVAIATSTAWSYSRGASSIVIGLIDSGVEWSLPALEGQCWINSPEDINGNQTLDRFDLNGIDEDGNGFVDDVIGYDFADQSFQLGYGDFLGPDAWPADENGHGTALASIMVAQPGISSVSGIAPGSRIMVLRCFDAEGYGEDDDIARAIVYAARNGARIVNCSFGDKRPSRLMHAAIQYAKAAGVTIVAASGNGTGAQPHFPSGFSEVIAVGGLSYDENAGNFYLWPLSGYFRVDWIAPADRVPALLPSGDVRLLSGTSIAAALSSAAAALLLSSYPYLAPEDVRASFISGAIPLGTSGWDRYRGSGRLYLPTALASPQISYVGWHYPALGASLSREVPFIFSTYHSLLQSWEISHSVSAEGPWQVLRRGNEPSFRDTLKDWRPLQGQNYLRLLLRLRNGREMAFLFPFSFGAQGIEITEADAVSGWNLGLAGSIAQWRLSFPATVCLQSRNSLSCADKIDSVGAVWIEAPQAESAQLIAYTSTDTVRANIPLPSTSPRGLPYAPWRHTNFSAPIGFYLPQVRADWNRDGEKDLIVSLFDPSSARAGKLVFLAKEGNAYVPYDSVREEASLLPRYLYDWDGDGAEELLAVWMDSFYVLAGSPPKEVIKRGKGRAARIDQNQTIWIRDTMGNYMKLSSLGEVQLSLPDTVQWKGSTTVPLLLKVRHGNDSAYVFGNYAGWIFYYTPQGQLLQAVNTRLGEVGSHLFATEITGDTYEEVIFLGRGRSENWWELGVLEGFSKAVLYRVRFWGAPGGSVRLFGLGPQVAVWLPPHLYVGTLTANEWKGYAFDGVVWGTFGIWDIGTDTLFLLGRDSMPFFYALELPQKPSPTWAFPGGISPTQARLAWHPIEGISTYELIRFQQGESPLLCYTGSDTVFLDNGLVPEATYYYLVRAANGGAFSIPFLIQPGERPCIDTAWREEDGTIILQGKGYWEGEEAMFFQFLPDSTKPLLAIGVGNQWILQCLGDPEEIHIDTLLTDRQGRYLHPSCTRLRIGRERKQDCIYPVQWQVIGTNRVSIKFSDNPPPEAYSIENYTLSPIGALQEVIPTAKGVELSLSISPLVHPVQVRWEWGNPDCPRQVSFSPREVSDKEWGIFPNPLRPHHKELYIWGLKAGTNVQVLTPDGVLCAQVKILYEDLPTVWSCRTLQGGPLAPGFYLIHAEYKEANKEWHSTQKLIVE